MFNTIAAPTVSFFMTKQIITFTIQQQNFFWESIYILINTLVVWLYKFLWRNRGPDLQSRSTSFILFNFESINTSPFTKIQGGFINSFVGPSLIRAPNQFACKGIEALHFIPLVDESTFLSISHSSTKIKLLKWSKPAFTGVKQEIKRAQKKCLFKNSVPLTSLYLARL